MERFGFEANAQGGFHDVYCGILLLYISCFARPFGQPTGEQAHNTHHQSSTWRLSRRRGESFAPLRQEMDRLFGHF